MGALTDISWCDHTFNGWWGCTKISEGCVSCYAATLSKRWGFDVWGDDAERRILSDNNWNQPLRWDRDALATFGRPARVFSLSMGDVFEDRRDLDEHRARLFALIAMTPRLDWLLLTKRPECVAKLVPWTGRWPANVWMGVTAENQRRLRERIPILLSLPARVRFVSHEPLVGQVSYRDAPWTGPDSWEMDGLDGIDWLIVGGESGPKHRPLDLDNARRLRDEASAAAGVSFFFKQVGGLKPTSGGDELDGRQWKQFPASVPRRLVSA